MIWTNPGAIYVIVHQSQERKPERTVCLSSLVSLLSQPHLNNQSTLLLKDQDPNYFKDIEFISVPVLIRVYSILCFRVSVHKKMRHGRVSQGHHCHIYHPRSVRVRRELSPLLLVVSSYSSVRAPFIKNISFMIASRTSQMTNGPFKEYH